MLNLAQIAAINADIIQHYDEQIAIARNRHHGVPQALARKQEYEAWFRQELSKTIGIELKE